MNNIIDKPSTITDRFIQLFRPESLPQDSRRAALTVIKNSHLFRYDHQNPSESTVAQLEAEFARTLGCKYALAVNSCGSAIQLALLSVGAKPGDSVLVPAFTFTAVISAIVNCGCKPVLVDVADDYCIDTTDLERKYRTDIRFFLLSYMRGRVARLDFILDFCSSRGITVVEDCAHSLGTFWRGLPTGTFSAVSCFSFHDKLLSCGEGGMLVTDNDHLLMRAAIMSGSYEAFWRRHLSHPSMDNPYQGHVPQFSMRMNEVSAAILRPQIPLIERWTREYREINNLIVSHLAKSKNIRIPETDNSAQLVANTVQFEIQNLNEVQVAAAIQSIVEKRIPIAHLGLHNRNDRCVWNWHYLTAGVEYSVPKCFRLLRNTCDLRLRRTMTNEDIAFIASTIVQCIDNARSH